MPRQKGSEGIKHDNYKTEVNAAITSNVQAAYDTYDGQPNITKFKPEGSRGRAVTEQAKAITGLIREAVQSMGKLKKADLNTAVAGMTETCFTAIIQTGKLPESLISASDMPAADTQTEAPVEEKATKEKAPKAKKAAKAKKAEKPSKEEAPQEFVLRDHVKNAVAAKMSEIKDPELAKKIKTKLVNAVVKAVEEGNYDDGIARRQVGIKISGHIKSLNATGELKTAPAPAPAKEKAETPKAKSKASKKETVAKAKVPAKKVGVPDKNQARLLEMMNKMQNDMETMREIAASMVSDAA